MLARTYYNGQNDPYSFVSGIYFAAANPNQNTPTPWGPAGSTVITGGQLVTNSITGDRIIANNITSGHIAAGQVTAVHVGANQIVTQSGNIGDLLRQHASH